MPTPNHLSLLLRGLLHLLFPSLCIACEQSLPAGAGCFCIRCRLQLEPTGHHLSAENEFTDRFWGRLPVHSGAAMYYFNRKSPVQHALHALKYRNKPDIGIRLGREFGRVLAGADAFRDIDAVVPVPLHPKKERQRGYNQSTVFARGIAEVLQCPLHTKSLTRPVFTATQTRKKRQERFENVGSAFLAPLPAQLKGKHILLADDVLTTGATLEACGATLLNAGAARISFATIAIAMNRSY